MELMNAHVAWDEKQDPDPPDRFQESRQSKYGKEGLKNEGNTGTFGFEILKD